MPTATDPITALHALDPHEQEYLDARRGTIPDDELADNIRQYRVTQNYTPDAESDPPPDGSPFVPPAKAEPISTTDTPPISARPSLREFVDAAKPINPGWSTPELVQWWNEDYGHVDPKTLPTLTTFLEKMQPANPDVPKEDLVAEWNDYFKPLGARLADRTIGDYLTNATNQFMGGIAQVPADMLKWVGKASEELDRLLPDILKNPAKAEDRFTYKLGESIQQLAEKTFPTDPELRQQFIASVLPNTFGQLVTFFAGGAVLSLGKAPLTASAILGAGVQGAEQYEESKQFKATDDAQRKSFWLGTALGTTEAAPLEFLFHGLPVAIGGRLWRMAATGAVVGAEELIQELGQQIGSNKVAELFYDKNRSLFEGAGIAAGAGGITGMVVGFISGILSRRTGHHAPPPAQAPPPVASSAPGAPGVPPVGPAPVAGGPPPLTPAAPSVSHTPTGTSTIADITLAPDVDTAIRLFTDVVEAPVVQPAQIDLFLERQAQAANAEVAAAEAALNAPIPTAPELAPMGEVAPIHIATPITPIPTPEIAPGVESPVTPTATVTPPLGSVAPVTQADAGVAGAPLATAPFTPTAVAEPLVPPSHPVSPEVGKSPVPEPSKPGPVPTQAGSETAPTTPTIQEKGELDVLSEMVKGRAERQAFLTLKGLTREQARTLSIKSRGRLQQEYVTWLETKPTRATDAAKATVTPMNPKDLAITPPHAIPPQTKRYRELHAQTRASFEQALRDAVSAPTAEERTSELKEILSRLENRGSAQYAEFVARTGLTLPANLMKMRKDVTAYFEGLRKTVATPVTPAAPVVETPAKGSPETLVKTEKKSKPMAPAVFDHIQEGKGVFEDYANYTLTEDVPGHKKGSTVVGKTLEDLGYRVPERPKTVVKPATTPPPTANIAAIPKGTMIELRGIRAATGEEITMPEDAAVALSELHSSLDRYRRLQECLGA